jgi:hypothetical protein
MQKLENKVIIKGFGNSETNITQAGTIQWNIINEEGMNQIIVVPQSYYVPTAGARLLSPQHRAQEKKEVTTEGTICATYGDKITMKLNNQSYTKKMPIIKSSYNTGMTWSNPGYNKYKQFESTLQQQCLSTTRDTTNHNKKIDDTNNDNDSCTDEENIKAKVIINDDEYAYEIQHTSLRNEKELLAYHERLGHIPFNYIQQALSKGLLYQDD